MCEEGASVSIPFVLEVGQYSGLLCCSCGMQQGNHGSQCVMCSVLTVDLGVGPHIFDRRHRNLLFQVVCVW